MEEGRLNSNAASNEVPAVSRGMCFFSAELMVKISSARLQTMVIVNRVFSCDIIVLNYFIRNANVKYRMSPFFDR